MSAILKALLTVVIVSLTQPLYAQLPVMSPGGSINEAARASFGTREEPSKPEWKRGVEVLTDLKGFDLDFYLKAVTDRVRKEWFSAIREMVDKPDVRKGKVGIEFKLARSGEVKDMRVVEFADGDLEDAAVQGIKRSVPLPAFPKDLQTDEISLRFHFLYMGKPGWWKRR